jgi:hypothetical protein
MNDTSDGAHSAPANRHPILVQRVPESGNIDVRILGPWDGIWTHRRGKRPHACPGEQYCKGPDHVKELKWKGYCPAQVWVEARQHEWVTVVLEVTEYLARQWIDRDLRGEEWRLWRMPGKGKQAPVTGELLRVLSSAEVKPAFSVRPIVHGFYGQPVIGWGVQPPYGAVAYAETEVGGAPPGRRERAIPREEIEAADRADREKAQALALEHRRQRRAERGEEDD